VRPVEFEVNRRERGCGKFLHFYAKQSISILAKKLISIFFPIMAAASYAL